MANDSNSSIVSPATVEARAKALDETLTKDAPEVKEETTEEAEPVVEAKADDKEPEPEEVKEPEVKDEKPKKAKKEAKAKEPVKEEVKPEPDLKAPPKAVDADPYKELRKEFTKRSQENAELKKEMEALKNSIEKITNKPVDLKELAKDPEALSKHISEKEAQFSKLHMEARNQARTFETRLVCYQRSQDVNYPDWDKAQIVMQDLLATKNPQFLSLDWENGKIEEVLDQAYEMVKPAIENIDWTKVPSYQPKAAAITPEDVKKREEAAERAGYEKAIKEAESRSKGSTVAGMSNVRSGRRPTTFDASNMSTKELEAYLKKAQGID